MDRDEAQQTNESRVYLSCPKIANVLNPPHIMFFLHGIKGQSRARLPIRVANQNTVGGSLHIAHRRYQR